MSTNRGAGTSRTDDGKKVAIEGDKKEKLGAIQEQEEDKDSLDYASMEGHAFSSDATESDTDIEADAKTGDPSSTPTKVNEFNFRQFLFEIQLTPNDVEKGTLFIPVETALDFFPPLTASLQRFYYEKIKISSLTLTRPRSMAITYDPEECLFLINSRKWQQLAHRHGFKAGDIIRFFKPFPRAVNTRFLIEHVQKADEEGTSSAVVVPEFKEENFLFQKILTLYEVRNLTKRPLPLPKREVKKHFSAVRIPVSSHRMERLYFTDASNKEWCWKFMFLSRTYMVVDGWEGFVNEHKVDAGDAIRFYKFIENKKLHPERHFLIQHVKKADVKVVNPPTAEHAAGTSTNPTTAQPGTGARNEENRGVGSTNARIEGSRGGGGNRRGGGRVSGNPRGGGRVSGNPRGGGRVRSNPRGGGRVSGNPRGSGRRGGNPRGSGRQGGNPRGSGRGGGNPRGGGRNGGRTGNISCVGNCCIT